MTRNVAVNIERAALAKLKTWHPLVRGWRGGNRIRPLALVRGSLGFDANTGRVNSQTYPTGLTVNTTYTPLGYPKQLIDARNGAALWTATSQDAHGHLLQTQLGNGLVTTNTYFKDGRLNTTRTGPGSAVQNLLYGYDLNRNISTRFDVGTGVTASYSYDELNRLRSESRSGGALGSTQLMAWTYDAIGNLASRTESGNTNAYNYNASGLGSRRPHAVGSVSGSVSGVLIPTYRYDDNGNLTSGAGRTVAWTSANMAKTVTSGAAQLNFHYSPEHERVKETYTRSGALQRTTVYINPGDGEGLFYEEDSGVAGTKRKHYISAGGSTVAVIVCTATPCTSTANSSTQYWHEDHLGSVAVVTNAAGAVVERMAYEPFGKRRNSNGVTDVNGTLVPSSTDRGYTEQEHMDEVALINLNGRIYDPALGRFMSADPTIPYPNATQSYNRYSYGRNNPLRMVDPSGFTDFGDADGCLSCAPTSNGGGYASPGSIGSFSMLPGDITWFSTGAVNDPLASFSGNFANSGIGGLGTFGPSGSTIGPEPSNFFVDNFFGRVVGQLVAPFALFTENNVNPLTGYIENFNGYKKAEAAIGLLTLGIGGEIRAEASVAKELAIATKEVMEGGTLIYRAASGTPASMTPRANDIAGLSAADSFANALPGKNQIIDTAKLKSLCAVCDNPATGHVSIFPKDMSQMQSWINSRGNEIHQFTRELMDAVIGFVHK